MFESTLNKTIITFEVDCNKKFLYLKYELYNLYWIKSSGEKMYAQY